MSVPNGYIRRISVEGEYLTVSFLYPFGTTKTLRITCVCTSLTGAIEHDEDQYYDIGE